MHSVDSLGASVDFLAVSELAFLHPFFPGPLGSEEPSEGVGFKIVIFCLFE